MRWVAAGVVGVLGLLGLLGSGPSGSDIVTGPLLTLALAVGWAAMLWRYGRIRP